ncbi:MAG: ATP-binding cassette domain-containing protein [Oscillospiraceae bacterium]|nr:ATP-binding cassette domain-containing protein [Oscillospiraceae bacterium]
MRLEIRNLRKDYNGATEVLKNINLYDEITTIALIGSSGCGKSTLLRIIGGLIPATSGEVLLDGELAADNDKYRKNIGFVFQTGGLFSHLSALDNIMLPLIKAHGFSEERAKFRADELLLRFGLESEAHKKPMQLSGGQKQRISIARAVAPKPKLLLLDEPTSALDPEFTTDVLDMIKELGEEKLSFIIATHEMGFALHACDKAAFLDNGEIAEYGRSKDVFKNPKTRKLSLFLSKLLEWKV